MARTYTIRELRPLAGDRSSAAHAINASGQVAGYSQGADGLRKAVVWDIGESMPARLASLENHVESVAHAINTGGRIAGVSFLEPDSFLHRTAVYWDGSDSITEVSDMAAFSAAYGVSDSGRIVGETGAYKFGPNAFAKDNQTLRADQLAPDARYHGWGSRAHAANVGGKIVGRCEVAEEQHAFSWRAGIRTDLETLGGPFSEAVALNEAGDVAGWSALAPAADGTSRYHACLWKAGQIFDLNGATAVERPSFAAGINAAVEVVGVFLTPAGRPRAFIWSALEGMVDLNSDALKLAGWRLDAATGINDAGQIVGHGVYNQKRRAFILTPAQPQVLFQKDAPSAVMSGDRFEYVIQFSHDTSQPVDAVITDRLPEGVVFVSSDDGGVYDPVTRRVTWNLTIPAGTPADPPGEVRCKVKVTAPGGTVLTNSEYWLSIDGAVTLGPRRQTYVGRPQLTVRLIKPASCRRFSLTERVSLAAEVNDLNQVTRVEFYSGRVDPANLVGTIETPQEPLILPLPPLKAGFYCFRAVAISSGGDVISEPLSIVVGTAADLVGSYKISVLEGGLGSEAVDLSEGGIAVGKTAAPQEGWSDPVYWPIGSINATSIAATPGQGSMVWGVNDSAGLVGTLRGPDAVEVGFVRRWTGAFTYLSANGAIMIPVAINSGGVVVGNVEGVGFKWENNAMTDLSGLAGVPFWASAINDRGTIAGAATFGGTVGVRPAIWSNGIVTDLGTLGGTAGVGMSINQRGDVVGEASTSDGALHAFRSRAADRVMEDIHQLGEASMAFDINDGGMSVGQYARPDHTRGGFIHVCGEMYDVEGLIPAGSGWRITVAMAVNDDGKMVCSAVSPSGRAKALLLTPVR